MLANVLRSLLAFLAALGLITTVALASPVLGGATTLEIVNMYTVWPYTLFKLVVTMLSVFGLIIPAWALIVVLERLQAFGTRSA